MIISKQVRDSFIIVVCTVVLGICILQVARTIYEFKEPAQRSAAGFSRDWTRADDFEPAEAPGLFHAGPTATATATPSASASTTGTTTGVGSAPSIGPRPATTTSP
jgi:hypothetical protein